ncbi:cation:proton antiporter [Cryptosporangium aurantiacum]|uniref:Kef-type K+ transport system, membrane component KefB n=1 Tax=Cryptosporangium aurantiacum TaxID=134849 RepID=A0A1M7RMJ8_9ACTN|nr:cation:proton antiporter [Cryptosporangium aurantiacum]SHN47316.1 Kef-type K+ transport system, membrane component KefB [Cryptosporangium aurantiacum]
MHPPDTKVQILLAVGVILVVAWLVGRLVRTVGQPRVLGEIIAGVVLGPSVLGLMLPSVADYLFPAPVVAALGILAQVGLVLFMFLVGLELDLAPLRGQGSRLAAVSGASIVVPLVLALVLAVALYPHYGADADRLAFCLFFGAAMAITAFPVLARLLRESGLAGTRVGALSLMSAAVNDVAAWCLVAVVIALGRSDGPAEVLRSFGLAAVYLAVMLAVVRPLLARLPSVPIWLVLVVAVFSAWFADQAGVHVIFGGFLAGVVMPRRPEWRQTVHERLDVVVSHLLLPVFFVVVGLSTHVDQLRTAADWAVVVLVIAVATVGKLGGSLVAARLVGERWPDAARLGVLMNTRGLTEIVVLAVGLQLGLITNTVFTIMVLMALCTTLMAAPLLRAIDRASPRERSDPAEPRPLDPVHAS